MLSTPEQLVLSSSSRALQYYSASRQGIVPEDGYIVQEVLACISVNGTQIAEIMCSPHHLDQLALGFLYHEGIITSMADVATIHISKKQCVDIWIHKEFTPPKRHIVTAGCGGGLTFDDPRVQRSPLQSSLQVYTGELSARMKELHRGADTYNQARGIHTAALATPDQLLLQVEDIGRHNCIDRLQGAALQGAIATQERLLFTSGRISSEMIHKAYHLGCPVVVSRTSPTSISLALATAWHITVVGYLRQDRMRIYTHPHRVLHGRFNLD